MRVASFKKEVYLFFHSGIRQSQSAPDSPWGVFLQI